MQVSEHLAGRASPTSWQPPERFAEYKILRPLGRGAMGQVFLAHDTLLDRAVAVKFLFAHHRSIVARQRFLVEARAAARLHHPNVVSVFRVGELGEHLYLVSELVTGASLDRIARPVGWPQIASIALDLARGLAAAHRRGVLHRDIKPANAIMAETGEVKLLDFGLAKLADGGEPAVHEPAALETADAASLDTTLLPGDMSSPGIAIAPPIHIASLARLPASPSELSDGVLGTPLYMAPEIWQGEPATPRSDMYSLGVLLYELCAGRVPHRASTIADLARIATENDAEPLLHHAPDLDARFAALVDRCIRRDPNERFATIDDLRLALERVVPAAPVVAATPHGNPYRGLAAFEAEHRALYFGREREIQVVTERLLVDPFVLVAGDSGVGKSSLCRAGVIPSIEHGALGERFEVITLVPGRRPLLTFATALARIVGDDEAAVAAALRDNPDELARRLRVALGTSRRLLVFVDQLEELVTLAPEDEADCAAAFLAALAVRSPYLRLLATVRGDFLTRLVRLRAFAGEIERAMYLLAPLDAAALRDVIVGPARVAGARFESDALVDELVAETAEDAALPLLQFALAQLWDARDRTTETITRASLVAIGGVAGALARHADQVVASLLPGPRRAAARVLVRLVGPSGTRRRRSEPELVPGDATTGPDARSALAALVRGRLVVARDDEAGTSYELAHEALISSWASLREWLNDEGGRRAVEQRLAGATAEWLRAGKSRDVLWSKRQLREAEALVASELSADQLDFLARSRRATTRRRWLLAGLGASLLLAAGVGWWIVQAEHARQTARRVSEHVAVADAALNRASTRLSEVERVRADALARFDRSDVAEAELRWASAHALQAEIDQALSAASQALEAALVVDPSRTDIRDRLASVLFQRALDAERWHREQPIDELLQRLRLYDRRGVFTARWEAPARLELRSAPALNARVALFRIERERGAEWPAVSVGELGPLPVAPLSLAPGSYLVRVRLADGRSVQYPVLLERDQRTTLELAPPAVAPPPGFVYVPPGHTLFGSSASEELRKSFFLAHPQHRRFVDGFAIARHETTYADWIEFLEALPPAERERRRPHFQNVRGLVDLRRANDGWVLTLQPSSQAVTAKQGEPLVFRGRDRRIAQDWLRMPVSGVTLDDARAYAQWLRETGRVPGARLCRELEWERAARGADERLYPHGDTIGIDDANIDQTYGRNPLGFGPDEVGSHPASASPFGVQDLAGNVFEWVESDEGYHLRGSSYYFDSLTAVANNRAPSEPGMRDPTLGVRICADAAR